MYLLLIAYYLSILNFYLGALIYALPIPLTGLKRWAPKLIVDAFFIASLALSIDVIINIAKFIQYMLGGNWSIFIDTVRSNIALRSIIIIGLDSLASYIRLVLPGVARIIRMSVNVLSISLYALIAIYILSVFIYKSLWLLTSLGIAFMSIPFRIARNGGAFLLSFALVFYIGLPLYYSFLSILFSPYQLRFTSPITQVYIVNAFDEPILDGYIGIELKDGTYIGPIPLTYGYSLINLFPNTLNDTISLYFDASGHQFYTNISNTSISLLCQDSSSTFGICTIKTKAYGVLAYRDGITLHVYPKPNNVDIYSFTNNRISMKVDTDIDLEIYISISEAYSITKMVIDNSILNKISDYLKYQWKWYDVFGNTYVVNLAPGTHTIDIELNYDSSKKVEPSDSIIYYSIMNSMHLYDNSFLNIFDEFSRILYIDIIGAPLYLSLLLSISLGLSKLIGGSSRLRVII
ncbi:hypothetical protein Igag_0132 [Ignisphaera aggregans DSM 17230]|uniref:Uncharacterized protein n=1 Tax=Ignisphaera aggregans (strain DSM 17230 / JCM 13409 / AQ1.S1) TaxID=583356 RepID=E0SPW1_IGNAA|nr:hypothetical protein Igag_0132 [Ignisphaera aggregans DSM 17230]